MCLIIYTLYCLFKDFIIVFTIFLECLILLLGYYSFIANYIPRCCLGALFERLEHLNLKLLIAMLEECWKCVSHISIGYGAKYIQLQNLCHNEATPRTLQMHKPIHTNTLHTNIYQMYTNKPPHKQKWHFQVNKSLNNEHLYTKHADHLVFVKCQ